MMVAVSRFQEFKLLLLGQVRLYIFPPLPCELSAHQESAHSLRASMGKGQKFRSEVTCPSIDCYMLCIWRTGRASI